MDSTDKTLVWVIGIIVGSMMAVIVAISFSTDTPADRISACMRGENMQYVGGNCIPIANKEN